MVPTGKMAGDEMSVTIGSNTFEVVVPNGVKEGESFRMVLAPANEECEYEVMVSTGAMAGDEISVTIGSNTFEVVVPDGVKEGESF